jgi:hypothetical protein
MRRLEAAQKAIMDFVHEKTLHKADPLTLNLCRHLRDITTVLALINWAFARKENGGLRDPYSPEIAAAMEKLSHLRLSEREDA